MFLGIKQIERFLKCSDVYPNGGFGSQVASNHPVVVDDHDLVLKPMVLGYPDFRKPPNLASSSLRTCEGPRGVRTPQAMP